jgi:alcohol dehydrogenase class IV
MNIFFSEVDVKEFFSKNLNAESRILVVTGKKSFQKIDQYFGFKDTFSEFGKVMYVNDFSPNPTKSELDKCLRYIDAESFDALVAIGGGSVIDFAKLLAFHSPSNVVEVDKFRFFALPSTAGTGSEVTQFATYYEDGIKKSLDDPLVKPHFPILIPKALEFLPLEIARNTCADAFCQAVESYWSIKSTDESTQFAITAIGKILNSGVEYIKERTPEACLEIAEASCLAGKAINITRTTACHSISYPMTSRYGIPHGQAVALTLVPILKFNSKVIDEDCNDSRGCAFVQSKLNELDRIVNSKTEKGAVNTITQFFEKIGVSSRLTALGMNEESIEIILKEGFTPQRMNNNPRRIGEKELRNILYEIL